MADQDLAPPVFEAVLRPHRSLQPAGFLILMLTVAGVSFVAGLAFLLMGAWPVFGFFGLDVLLIYAAFRLNYHSGRAYETVRLTADALDVRKVAADGDSSDWRFQPYWVRLSFDDPPEHGSQIALSSHGRSLTVGSFLSPDERAEFAGALRQALRELRR